ncbi:MAG: aldehyde ferredoxin oxidoreductase C-terminal domain-containing protein, partial [Proteobacteria bacterium]|nr:aldehyde ferredoxin oxidoreductase C-terminal domain-containing protein [Pseudomonadota bacterium]
GFRNNQWETDERASALSGETYRDKFFVKSTSCARCPVACGKISKVEQGAYAPLTAKTPEYESLFSLGTMQELFDPAAVLEANRLCDELGVDTITMGVTLAFACECVEKGLLSREGVGFSLEFGNAEASLEAIRRTAAKEGFGARLAEGSVRLAAEIGNGAERFLYAVRGAEIAAHSARILKGMSLGYATGTRGGSHQDTRPTMQYGPDQDNRDPAAQPAWAVRSQHFTAVGDSLAQCRLVAERGFGKMINDTYAEMIHHVTGWDVTADELERIGERIYNLERAFNVREGTRRAEDALPYRVMNEPVPSGAHEGMHCPQAELDGMLDAYYRLRSWSPEGVPSREKLEDLGLTGVADDLGY